MDTHMAKDQRRGPEVHEISFLNAGIGISY